MGAESWVAIIHATEAKAVERCWRELCAECMRRYLLQGLLEVLVDADELSCALEDGGVLSREVRPGELDLAALQDPVRSATEWYIIGDDLSDALLCDKQMCDLMPGEETAANLAARREEVRAQAQATCRVFFDPATDRFIAMVGARYYDVSDGYGGYGTMPATFGVGRIWYVGGYVHEPYEPSYGDVDDQIIDRHEKWSPAIAIEHEGFTHIGGWIAY